MKQDKALAIINQHKNSPMLFVGENDITGVTPTFEPVVSVLDFRPDEFHNMSGGKMPNGDVTSRIGNLAGVTFVSEDCGVEKLDDHTWVGRARGKRRDLDGNWIDSGVMEYELDAELRAEMEVGTNEGKAYQKKLLEWKKFARQKADTGARLRVIRRLTGIPTKFSQDQLNNPIVLVRYVQNSEYILNDPDGRRMAMAQATGAMDSIYGPRSERRVSGTHQSIPAPTTDTDENVESGQPEQPDDDGFDDFGDGGDEDLSKEEQSRMEAVESLRQLLKENDWSNYKKRHDQIQAAIDTADEWPIEKLCKFNDTVFEFVRSGQINEAGGAA